MQRSPRKNLLNPSCLLAILSSVERIGASETLEDFRKSTLVEIQKLVPSDSITYNAVDLVAHSNEVVFLPESIRNIGDMKVFESLMHEHPIINYSSSTGDGSAWRISDFIDLKKHRESRLYQEFFHKFPVDYQIAISFRPNSRSLDGIACNRSAQRADFSEKDRQILNCLRPHLSNTLQKLMMAESKVGTKNVSRRQRRSRNIPLSNREGQVLGWIAEGLSTTRIAKLMGISPLTVKTHTRNILEKMSAKNRVHAVQIALKAGWL